jgi:type VI secretion system secreted protein VgrG
MRQDVFTLKCDKLESASFVGFRGTETISKPYEFELFFTVPVGTAVRAVVGERATIKGERSDSSEPFVLHGVIASVRLLHQTAERALYQALLVPRVWLLRQFWRSYVFTHRNLKEFLTDTLKAGGVHTSEFRFDINESLYPIEEFVAQYRETHIDFLHRWLEREGLYYYFEHKLDTGHEVMVIVDERGRHLDFPGSGRVSYTPLFGDDVTAPEGLHQLEAETRWLPKSVTIADYNYANPSATLRSEGAVTKAGHGAIMEYGYRSFDQSNIKRLANVRGQAIGCRETMLRASGDALGPRAGYRFAIDERPDDVEESWLALEVTHVGSIAGMTPEVTRLTKLSTKETYEVRLTAIPSDVQYRAPQETPWPRIFGFENGIVCGEAASPYAQLDKDGRYLVRFEFDTSDLPDGKASTRVRMLQPHGGEKEGFHFPLRKGTEVMIGFLGGDPDRPFIAGVVPNAHKPSVVGERNHTQNVLRSGSGNQIVLEDDEGKEFVFISTPNHKTGFYMGNPTGAHSGVYTGEGDDATQLFVSADQADPAVGPVLVGSTGGPLACSLATDGNMGFTIGGSFWMNVDANIEWFVKGNASIGYRGALTLHVGKDSTENYYANRITNVTAGQTDTIKGTGLKQTIESKLDQTITGAWKTEVVGTWDGHFTGNVKLKSDTEFKIEAPVAKVTATDYKIKVAAFTFDISPNKHELYTYKGATGALKIDWVAASQSITGIKSDVTLIKMETAPFYKGAHGAVVKEIGSDIKTLGLASALAATILWNAAFTKL